MLTFYSLHSHINVFSHVRGLHLNMVITVPPYGPLSYIQAKLFFPESEQTKVFPIKNKFLKTLMESGYFHLQGTSWLKQIDFV